MSQTDLKFYRDEEERSYIPLGAARGCRQTLTPLASPLVHRTLEGKLVTLNPEAALDKYASTIICEDLHPIAFDDLKAGSILWVECIQRILTPEVSPGQTLTLKRPAVPGSILLLVQNQAIPLPAENIQPDNRTVQLNADQGPGYLSYRPLLQMMLMEYSMKTREWEGVTEWMMQFQEI